MISKPSCQVIYKMSDALFVDLYIHYSIINQSNVRITVLPSHSCGGTLQNLHLKRFNRSTQTSADRQSGQRQVSRMTDEKGETWNIVKSEEQARVTGGRLFHAGVAATAKARSPGPRV